MTSIFEITDRSHVASFFVWTLAVCAIAKGLFGSLPAAELQYRFSLRDAPRRQRMNRLSWEINNRAVWDEDVARRSPHAAKQTDRHRDRRAPHGVAATRAVVACVASVHVFHGVFRLPDLLDGAGGLRRHARRGRSDRLSIDGAAYSGAAVPCLAVTGRTPTIRTLDGTVGTSGCKSCGK
ncbi:MAG TPA: hypothetical protein PKC49_12160 [Phycisphaerae bacterium]|nr:hypothetical protein [Phycisphaerae bacterium]